MKELISNEIKDIGGGISVDGTINAVKGLLNWFYYNPPPVINKSKVVFTGVVVTATTVAVTAVVTVGTYVVVPAIERIGRAIRGNR